METRSSWLICSSLLTVFAQQQRVQTSIKPADGNKWVFVNVTVANTGTEQGSVSSILMFKLKDKEGVKYNWTIGDGAKGSVDGNLVVGGKIKGELTYEVPITVNNFDLEVQGSIAGAVAVVSISTK